MHLTADFPNNVRLVYPICADMLRHVLSIENNVDTCKR